MSAEYNFHVDEKVVYPTHGVGVVRGTGTSIIGGREITTYIVYFENVKMTVHIPVDRAYESGLRSLSTKDDLDRARTTLKGSPKTSRGMWSRRAKEYESKINSGNIVSIAEVVRDLHKNVDDPDRSYSERIIYENALDRLAGEFAAVNDTDQNKAANDLINTLGPANNNTDNSTGDVAA